MITEEGVRAIRLQGLRYSRGAKIDGFVKSPSAIRQAHGPEHSRRAAFRFILRQCTVLLCTAHSSGFARLAFGSFFFAVVIRVFTVTSRLTEGEPRIIEIAARLGGDYLCDFVEMIYDVDMVEAVMQIALGEEPDIKVNASSGIVKGKYLLPKRAGIITRLNGIKEVERISGVKAVKIFLKEGDRVRIPPEGFDYIGWVVAWSKSSVEVVTIMNDAFEKIRIGIHS